MCVIGLGHHDLASQLPPQVLDLLLVDRPLFGDRRSDGISRVALEQGPCQLCEATDEVRRRTSVDSCGND
jgi:hypothetical protein